MPRPGPVRPSVTLRLDADTIEYLDMWAADKGVTRSDLIRQAIESALNTNRWHRPAS